MTWIILGVLALIVIFVIVSYNGLVKNRMQTKEAWSQIDVQLKRRNDLLPNLIETVKGYAKYEGSTLEKVTELRRQVATATSPAEAMKASDALSRQISGIFAVAENYPDLKASANFIKLQEELTNTENKISFSRQFYNDTVTEYNQTIQMFPGSLFAGFFNYHNAELFKANDMAREEVQVKF